MNHFNSSVLHLDVSLFMLLKVDVQVIECLSMLGHSRFSGWMCEALLDSLLQCWWGHAHWGTDIGAAARENDKLIHTRMNLKLSV